jgi:aspartokinase/homoserine dehydrogenase 1
MEHFVRVVMEKQESINGIINESIFLEQNRFPTIDYVFKNESKISLIFADREQISRALTNILKNASESIEQIKSQKKFIANNLKLNLKVFGISNSSKMIISDSEIDLENWKKLLDDSKTNADRNIFQEKVLELNLRNSLFIDNTASDLIANTYKGYLKNGIGIITCNKIANSDVYTNYEELKSLSRDNNAPFLYETNVGAALPVISTLNNLINSGDKIIKIEAVLSGTLNYIFNNFQEINTFHEIVTNAVDLGYTEPDPKIDLCGIDVSRKILILARESGYKLEFKDINKNHFLPDESVNAKSKDEFLSSLKKNNDHFNAILLGLIST